MSTRRDFLKKAGLLATAFGMPSLGMQAATQQTDAKKKSAKMPVDDRWDVIVVGGGPAGCTAAISAAREGGKVLVIEATGQLGGMGSLSDIYAECKKLLSAGETSKSTNNSIDSTIRRTIYQHSSDVTAYLGKEDLFQQVGPGLWQLRNREAE